MPSFPEIHSFRNDKIKLANKLLAKRQREQSGLFVVDDARDMQRALAHNYTVEFALYCPDLATEDDHTLAQSITQAPVYRVSAELIAKAGYRQNPGGLVAVLRQKPPRSFQDATRANWTTLLGLVGLRKPGNIGALLRTADAAGMDAVLLIDTPLDRYNPNIIRASTGAVFLDILYQGTSEEAQQWFAAHHIAVLATHLKGHVHLYDYDFTARPTVILLGAEDTGLEDTWVQNCDALVKIPMLGQMTDSLNVSVSGALCMYEALRQRFASLDHTENHGF